MSGAAGEACRRAVSHAINAGDKKLVGYPSALSVKTWGFYDIAFGGKEFQFERPFGSYVMENILFTISFPAEFHAQTAVECAMQLHPQVADRIDDIERSEEHTYELQSLMRISYAVFCLKKNTKHNTTKPH